MLNTKQMLKDGFRKVQVAVMTHYDRNGKGHLIIVDTMEHARKYKCSDDDVKLATMFIKND